MLRSSMDTSAATRGVATSSSSRAALPPRAVLLNTNSIVASAVGVSRSVSSIPRALAASACASTSGSSHRVEMADRGLGTVDRRRKITRSRRARGSASATKGDNDEQDEQQPSASSSSSPSSSSDASPDVATLRAKLDAAIDAEDYALAASLRDALRALEDDAVAGVTEANARFYAAFRAADIDVMASCLGFGDNVTVIHPGCNAIRGREAVLESWRVIFSGATRAAGRGAAVALDIEAVDVQVYAPPAPKDSDSSEYSSPSNSENGSIGSSSSSSNNSKGTGALGVVTCVERVDGGDSTGRVVATNVFERGSDGRYRMILHHGSSAPPLRRKA